MKKCSTCGIKKELSEFHRQSESKDGHKNVCKSCISEHNSTMHYWRTTDSESYNNHVFSRKKYFEKNYPQYNYEAFKSWITRNGVGINDMTLNDIDDHINNWITK